MYADFWYYYRIDLADIIRGDGPAPSLALALVQRLPYDSLTVALESGGEHLFGWTPERLQLADIFDALNINTRATGMWDKKPPRFPLASRPQIDGESSKTQKSKKAQSVAELYLRFSGGK